MLIRLDIWYGKGALLAMRWAVERNAFAEFVKILLFFIILHGRESWAFLLLMVSSCSRAILSIFIRDQAAV